MIVASTRFLIVAILCLPFSDQADLPTPYEETKILQDASEMRKKLAKQHNIANMYELHWDDDLAVLLSSVECEEDGAPYKGPGRVIVVSRKMKDENHEEMLRRTMVEDLPAAYRAMEIYVHPLQTNLACAFLNCTFLNVDSMEMVEMEQVCIMGPYSDPPRNHIRKGPPASICGNLGTKDTVCKSAAKPRKNIPITPPTGLIEKGKEALKSLPGKWEELKNSDEVEALKNRFNVFNSAAGTSIALSIIVLAAQL